VKTTHAIYEKGVFRPTEPIQLPEGTEVEIPAPSSLNGANLEPDANQLDAVYEILSRRRRSGRRDTAERHNEHQP
jgi:predicted DNA-binding antitoxin AbrB/MazE fold protein